MNGIAVPAYCAVDVVFTDARASFPSLADFAAARPAGVVKIEVSGIETIEQTIKVDYPTEIRFDTRFRLSPGARLVFGPGCVEYVDPLWFGATAGDDDTVALQQALDAAGNGNTVDLRGRTYTLYKDYVVTTLAQDIDRVLSVRGRTGLTVVNGTLRAYDPGRAPAKQYYPSVLAFDQCSDLVLRNLVVIARGESYGDADASQSADHATRARFLSANGGHALVLTRSARIEISDSTFLGAGSTGAFYSSSTGGVTLTRCFASALSLGYFGFAFDAWCGNAEEQGQTAFDARLTDCASAAYGSAYGSKGCVGVEDRDCVVTVEGGSWKDAYANRKNHDLGAAFSVSSATLLVRGGEVENCAAVGRTGQSSLFQTRLDIVGVTATRLRTAAHVQTATSFGSTEVSYEDSRFSFAPTEESTLWPEQELSTTAILANQKVSGTFGATFLRCTGDGVGVLVSNATVIHGSAEFRGGEYRCSALAVTAGYDGRPGSENRGMVFGDGMVMALAENVLTSPITLLRAGQKKGTIKIFLDGSLEPSAPVRPLIKADDATRQSAVVSNRTAWTPVW